MGDILKSQPGMYLPACLALPACNDFPLRKTPDQIMFELPALEGRTGDCFPCKSCLAWRPDMGEDILILWSQMDPAFDTSTG